MKIVKYIFGLLIIVSIFSTFIINDSSAAGMSAISITKTINSEDGKDSKKVEGVNFGLIKISSDTDVTDEKKKDLLKEYSPKPIEELTKALGGEDKLKVSDATDANGNTVVKGLEPGTYFITEVKKSGEKWIVDKSGVPLVVSVSADMTLDVHSKSYDPGVDNEKYKNILVKKYWKGAKLSSIQVQLFANGEKIDEAELSESNSWTHVFRKLPKYDSNKKLIDYSVKEVVPDGYSSKVESKNNKSEFDVTNYENGNKIEKHGGGGGGGGSKSIIRTGDWTIYPLVGSGVMLMALGYRIYRK